MSTPTLVDDDLVIDLSHAPPQPTVSPMRRRGTWARDLRRNPSQMVAVVFALGLVSIPTLWIVLASFKTRDELYRLPVQIFPRRSDLTITTEP